MKKIGIKAIWETCEKVIAYLALSIVVILECIDMFIPSMNFSGSDFSLGLIASSLLVIFAHIEDIKKSFDRNTTGQVSSRFNDGLLDVFQKNKHLKTLDIMAHTTKTYIHSIADNDVTIEKVRILVCKPKERTTRHYPDDSAVQSLDVARDQAVESWKDLHRLVRCIDDI